jgi:hypothetical protein
LKRVIAGTANRAACVGMAAIDDACLVFAQRGGKTL